MAARVPGEPGDPVAAALDDLARNFTYGGPAAANGSLSRAWYRSHQGHLFGVLLAILGHVVISISLNIQKISYVQLAQESRPHFRNALWWAGTTFLALGEVGNFAAYGLAPITLIAPLGCVSVSGSAIISVIFLRENLRASDLLGITLAFAGTYLLVNFAPCAPQTVTARTIQYYFVGWKFMVYVILEILVFCILLYFHKRKGLKHMAILLSLVSLLASLTVIAARAISGMLTASVADPTQLTYPIFYVMIVIMIASCICQVKFLGQATALYSTAAVVPANHVFFTISAIMAGIIFYQEFLGATFLTVFIYLFGCLLSFLGVVLVTRIREKEQLPQPYIDFGNIPGKQRLDTIQPDTNGAASGPQPEGNVAARSPHGEKKEA
ncbi:NIPA-like protein 2 [Suncus etruscus]|uniref:NIPA-like protein 2 n=1 Tax=Suncus etruscus TaxID=109475 RepID=UPI00210F44D9|nr:NIPA-like protein 2 [Suncus etruscus]